MRSTPGFGSAKTGGNYAAALRHVLAAKDTQGDAQETGTSNFFLLDDKRLLTKPLDDTFLHRVARETLNDLAATWVTKSSSAISRWLTQGLVAHDEAALSGTAAVLAGVGTFIHDGTHYTVGDGAIGPNTQR